MINLREQYDNYIAKNNYKVDNDQIRLLNQLEHLTEEFCEYIEKKKGFVHKMLSLFAGEVESPKGLYIYGGVGKGKTTLSKIFFDSIDIKEKLFIHFHNFMLMVHEGLRRIRAHEDNKAEHSITTLAMEIAEKYTLICLDEFHVMDVADAMILSKLISDLYQFGVVIVLTSNRPPHDLYKQDYGKEQFQNFITTLLKNMDAINLDSKEDYRLNKLKSIKDVFFVGNDSEKVDIIIKGLFEDGNPKFSQKKLEVQGREVILQHTYNNILYSTFQELCVNYLSQLDYIEICKHFSIIVIKDIPKMNRDMVNQAKRLMMLIDQMYVNNAMLIASSSVPIDEMYMEGNGSFEFERTKSRIHEMQSAEYLGKVKIELKVG